MEKVVRTFDLKLTLACLGVDIGKAHADAERRRTGRAYVRPLGTGVTDQRRGLRQAVADCVRETAFLEEALNLNVQSVEELKDAQVHPEKYENLQVRVAGWNVRWNDLCKTEQDAYIRRAENVMKGF